MDVHKYFNNLHGFCPRLQTHAIDFGCCNYAKNYHQTLRNLSVYTLHESSLKKSEVCSLLMFNRPDLNLSVTTNGDYNLSLSIAYLIMHVER